MSRVTRDPDDRLFRTLEDIHRRLRALETRQGVAPSLELIDLIGQFSRHPGFANLITCPIPEPYESIIIDYYWRLSSNVPTTTVGMYVNGNATSTYNTSWTALSGAAFLSGVSGAFVNAGNLVVGLIPRPTGSAAAYGRAILHRAAATGAKGLFFIEYWLHDNSSGNHGVVIGGGTTPSTGAVTLLDFVTGADMFSADSYVRLYGLRP